MTPFWVYVILKLNSVVATAAIYVGAALVIGLTSAFAVAAVMEVK